MVEVDVEAAAERVGDLRGPGGVRDDHVSIVGDVDEGAVGARMGD